MRNACVIGIVVMLALAGCEPDETPIPQETSDLDLEADDDRPRSVAAALMAEDVEEGLAVRAAGGYDRARARAYIERYALSPNPRVAYCGRWGLSGRKPQRIAADCTNFASQVLWYAGLPEDETGNEATGWWYRNGCDARGSSRSWRQVNELLYRLTVETGDGEFRGRAEELQVGDLIFYKLRRAEDGWRCDGSFRFNHTAVVSGHDSRGQPLVSYHSNDALDVPWDAKSGSRGALGEACQTAFVHIRDR
jgi:hypothetical protein